MKQVPEYGISSIWLLACSADEELFGEIVSALADRHGTPRFHPHLTLASNVPQSPAHVAPHLPAIAAVAHAFTVPVSDIVTTELFFRSFYASFALTPALQALRDAAQKELAQDFGLFTPHISLLYGPAPDADKQRSAAEVRSRLQGRAIRFDRLALTNSADDVPIADWQIVGMAALSTG